MKHKLSDTAEYHAWNQARHRCLNPDDGSYANYGGRGITMYAAWLNNFKAFYEYIGPKPGPTYSLDRINTNGNYEPGNVRWATKKEQANNQRPRRDQRLLRVGCFYGTPREWARALNSSAGTTDWRIAQGYSDCAVVLGPKTSGIHNLIKMSEQQWRDNIWIGD